MRIGIAFYYCQGTSAIQIFRSLIAQLFVQSKTGLETLGKFYAEWMSSHSQPSDAAFVSLLCSLLGSFEKCYVVLDGCRNCTDPDRLFQWLREVWDSQPSFCTFISRRCGEQVTSRSSSAADIVFTIEERHVAGSAEILLQAQLRNSSLYPMSSEMQDEVKMTLLSQAHGVYAALSILLIPRLMIYSSLSHPIFGLRRLAGCKDPVEIRTILSKPMKELFAPYVCGQEESIMKSAYQLLEILCVAKRSLLLSEIKYICLNREAADITPVKFHSTLDAVSDFLAFSQLAYSTIVDDSSYSVKLVHPDVKSILCQCSTTDIDETERLMVSKPNGNLAMAGMCLSQLLRLTRLIDPNSKELSAEYPLLQYASHYWYIHVHQSDEVAFEDLLVTFFSSRKCFARWLSIHDPDRGHSADSGSRRPSPLYYACLLDFPNLAEALHAKGFILDSNDEPTNHPPDVRIRFEEVAQTLLRSKATIRSQPNQAASDIPPSLSFIFHIELLRPDYAAQPRRQDLRGSWVPPDHRYGYKTSPGTVWRW